MPTTRVNLDVTQYVRVTSDPFTPSSLLLQSHRDTVRIVFNDAQPVISNTVFHELGGEHPPLDIPMTEVAVWALAMTGRSALTVTEQRLPIEISALDTIGVAVNIQDQTTQSLNLLFNRDLDTTTLDGATTLNSRFFDVLAGDGSKFTVGNLIEIAEGTRFIQARVLGIVTDTIEIDSPINNVYADLTVVTIKDDNLNVDGSVTPQVFAVSPETGQLGDVTRMILRCEGTSDMDSGTFGTLPPLTNGVVIRKKLANGDFINIMNFKTNGDFVSQSFSHDFLPNNGNGVRLFVGRITWAGQEKHGVVQRLDGTTGEELQCVIQDDLTGISLTVFTLAVQGHEVQP